MQSMDIRVEAPRRHIWLHSPRLINSWWQNWLDTNACLEINRNNDARRVEVDLKKMKTCQRTERSILKWQIVWKPICVAGGPEPSEAGFKSLILLKGPLEGRLEGACVRRPVGPSVRPQSCAVIFRTARISDADHKLPKNRRFEIAFRLHLEFRLHWLQITHSKVFNFGYEKGKDSMQHLDARWLCVQGLGCK